MSTAKSFNKKKKKRIYARYIEADAKQSLEKLVDQGKVFKLIMTSPPYNLAKEYEKKSSMDRYRQEVEEVVSKLKALLHEKGSICWQVGNYVDPRTREVLPLDIFYHDIFRKNGFILRNRIIWHFEHGLHASQKFSGRYETIMWYTKNGTYTFNLDKVRIPAKYPGKTYYKGKNKGKVSGNPKGKNPSDVWSIISAEWARGIWDIPNVKANHKEKTIHPCQYPIELVERCVLALTRKDDWILDPYAGVGSTLLAALKNRRNSVGIERVGKYVKVGRSRLAKMRANKLPVRALGTPVFIPSKNLAVAKKPKHFQY